MRADSDSDTKLLEVGRLGQQDSTGDSDKLGDRLGVKYSTRCNAKEGLNRPATQTKTATYRGTDGCFRVYINQLNK